MADVPIAPKRNAVVRSWQDIPDLVAELRQARDEIQRLTATQDRTDEGESHDGREAPDPAHAASVRATDGPTGLLRRDEPALRQVDGLGDVAGNGLRALRPLEGLPLPAVVARLVAAEAEVARLRAAVAMARGGLGEVAHTLRTYHVGDAVALPLPIDADKLARRVERLAAALSVDETQPEETQ